MRESLLAAIGARAGRRGRPDHSQARRPVALGVDSLEVVPVEPSVGVARRVEVERGAAGHSRAKLVREEEGACQDLRVEGEAVEVEVRYECHLEPHVLLQVDLRPPRARLLRARPRDGLRIVSRVARRPMHLQHRVAGHKALLARNGAVGLDNWSPPVFCRDDGLASDNAAVQIDAARVDSVLASPGQSDLDDDGELCGRDRLDRVDLQPRDVDDQVLLWPKNQERLAGMLSRRHAARHLLPSIINRAREMGAIGSGCIDRLDPARPRRWVLTWRSGYFILPFCTSHEPTVFTPANKQRFRVDVAEGHRRVRVDAVSVIGRAVPSLLTHLEAVVVRLVEVVFAGLDFADEFRGVAAGGDCPSAVFGIKQVRHVVPGTVRDPNAHGVANGTFRPPAVVLPSSAHGRGPVIKAPPPALISRPGLSDEGVSRGLKDARTRRCIHLVGWR
mmetsp:Transcript_10982/g.36368  ORF Transcript_10982/g.36368 Transcript_10982/m.36368 type:complete len:446 (+) Transcript_10982:1071-2408(+)